MPAWYNLNFLLFTFPLDILFGLGEEFSNCCFKNRALSSSKRSLYISIDRNVTSTCKQKESIFEKQLSVNKGNVIAMIF